MSTPTEEQIERFVEEMRKLPATILNHLQQGRATTITDKGFWESFGEEFVSLELDEYHHRVARIVLTPFAKALVETLINP